MKIAKTKKEIRDLFLKTAEFILECGEVDIEEEDHRICIALEFLQGRKWISTEHETWLKTPAHEYFYDKFGDVKMVSNVWEYNEIEARVLACLFMYHMIGDEIK